MPERTVFQSMSQRHVISLGPQATIWDAACLMTKANCGSVLIVDPASALLGIVTERDLMTRVLAKALNPLPAKRQEVISEFVHDLKAPGARFHSQRATPLIERNPVLFWK